MSDVCADEDPPGVGDAPSEDDEEKARLVKHEDMVFLDRRFQGDWQLTNIETYERKLLPALGPGEEYVLGFDSDGFASATVHDKDGVEMPDRDIVYAEDVLQWSLWSLPNGSKLVSQVRSDGANHDINLDDFGQEYTSSTLSIDYGPSAKTCKFDVAYFRWHRGGNRVFISVGDLYENLNLKQFGGASSRWIWNGIPRWERQMDLHGIKEGIQNSSQVGKFEKGAAAKSGRKPGPLPFMAFSPNALLFMLDRFGFRGERHCGFKQSSESYRLNSQWLLESFLEPIIKMYHGQTIRLQVCTTWENKSPRPEQFDNYVEAVVDVNGDVQLDHWRRRGAELGAMSLIAKSFLALTANMQDNKGFLDVWKALGDPTDDLLRPLFAQLVFLVGTSFHKHLVELGRSGTGVHGSYTMKKVDVEDTLSVRGDLDNMLYRYVRSCVKATSGQQYWSCCSDKSAVGGFSLQATCFAFGDNTGIVAPPSVCETQTQYMYNLFGGIVIWYKLCFYCFLLSWSFLFSVHMQTRWCVSLCFWHLQFAPDGFSQLFRHTLFEQTLGCVVRLLFFGANLVSVIDTLHLLVQTCSVVTGANWVSSGLSIWVHTFVAVLSLSCGGLVFGPLKEVRSRWSCVPRRSRQFPPTSIWSKHRVVLILEEAPARRLPRAPSDVHHRPQHPTPKCLLRDEAARMLLRRFSGLTSKQSGW